MVWHNKPVSLSFEKYSVGLNMGARVIQGCAVPIARVKQTYYAAVFLTVAGKVRLLASCITRLIDILATIQHIDQNSTFLKNCFCVTKQNSVVLMKKNVF
jgi:hypothetical protein